MEWDRKKRRGGGGKPRIFIYKVNVSTVEVISCTVLTAKKCLMKFMSYNSGREGEKKKNKNKIKN